MRKKGINAIGIPLCETTIRLHVEPLKEGGFLATSPDVPGLVAEGRSIVETAEIAQDVARKIIESCIEHGDPLPEKFIQAGTESVDLLMPVSIR
jgi:predicted RNase H-like HicB family nuclease